MLTRIELYHLNVTNDSAVYEAYITINDKETPGWQRIVIVVVIQYIHQFNLRKELQRLLKDSIVAI